MIFSIKNYGFSLSVSALEVESYLPSVQAKIEINFESTINSSVIETNVWFEFSTIEAFRKSLLTLLENRGEQTIELKDMSSELVIRFSVKNDGMEAFINSEIKRETYYSYHFNFSSKIDIDIINVLIQQLNEYRSKNRHLFT